MDSEFRDLLDYVETRKAVKPVDCFMDEAALTQAIKLEEVLLRRCVRESERTLPAISAHLTALSKRA